MPSFKSMPTAKGASLPYVPGGDFRAKIEAAYREVMGRDFDPGEPRTIDYGAPNSDDYEALREGVRVWGDDYYNAFKAWQESPEYVEYRAACERFYARRDQFLYSPRARNRQLVLEAAAA